MIQETVNQNGGKIIKNMGDGFFVLFAEGSEPLKCALELQRKFQRTAWGPIKDLRIRIALHTGPARKIGDDYFGPTINRTARVMGLGHGGQILLTPDVINEHEIPPGAAIRDLGSHVLRGLTRPHIILGLEHPDLKIARFTSLLPEPVEIAIKTPTPARPGNKEAAPMASGAGQALASPAPGASGAGQALASPAPGASGAGQVLASPAPVLRGLSATFDQTHTFELSTTVGARGTANGQFMLPSGAAVDRQDRVYVSDAIRCNVQVFEPSGLLIKRLGRQGTLLETDLTLNNPTALAIDHEGRVFICDTKNSRIVIVDPNGNILNRIGRPLVVMGLSEPPGVVGFNFPRGIAVDAGAGIFYVADTGNNRLRLFRMDGEYIRSFGMWGQGLGEFVLPLGLAVGPRGTLYVADSDNYRIQVFDRELHYVRTIGRRGPAPAEFHRQPSGIVVTPDDDILVSDGSGRIKIFNYEGTYLGSFSGKRISDEVPHYCAVALNNSSSLVAVDEHSCQWHRYDYREITE
jgi:DNA-binding beta-propeller fold protein YncE